MNCLDAQTAMNDWLDDELNEPDRRSLEQHLAYCAACAADWSNCQSLRDNLTALSEAADEIASAPAIVRFKPMRWIAIAAAIAGLAVLFNAPRINQTGQTQIASMHPVRSIATPAAPPPNVESVISSGESRWVVAVMAADPSVTIVWAYAPLNTGAAPSIATKTTQQ